MPEQKPGDELVDLAQHLSGRTPPESANAADDVGSDTSQTEWLSDLRDVLDELGKEFSQSGEELEAMMSRHPWLVASASFLLGFAVARVYSRGE